jgi:hypothetical protein
MERRKEMKKFMIIGLSYVALLIFIFVLLGKVSDLRGEMRNLREDIYGESKDYMLVTESCGKTYMNPYGAFLPDDMADFITECCGSFGVSTNLVVAVLEMENPSLDVSAVSKPNDNGTCDVGLFQLNDRSLYSKDGFLDKYWNSLLGEFNPDNWKNSAYVAIKFIGDLEKMFGKDNVYWIACAYNAGSGRAYKEWTKTDDDKQYLPESTRTYYGPMVVNNWKKWNAFVTSDNLK